MGRWTLEHTENLCSDKFHLALQKPLKSSGLKLEEFCEGFDPQDPLIQKLIGALVQDVARRKMDILHLAQPALHDRCADASTYITTGLPVNIYGSYPYARRRNHQRIRRRHEIHFPTLEHEDTAGDWRSPSFVSTEEENEAADLGSSTSLNLYEAYANGANAAERESRQVDPAHRYFHDISADAWLPPAQSSAADLLGSSASFPPPYRPETVRSSQSPQPTQPFRLAPSSSRRVRGSSTLQRQPSIRMRSRTVDFSEFHNRRNQGIRLAAEVEGGSPPLDHADEQPSLAGFGSAAASSTPLDANGRMSGVVSGDVVWHTGVSQDRRSLSPALEHPVSSMRSSFALASTPVHHHSSFLSPHDYGIEGYGYSLPNTATSQLHRSPSPLPSWEETHWR
ncbi:hypothetical protein FRB94_000150 [Tulasnella sp. JGI-2019a]|nr:hypothetical protein FRB94_000150 [Tulasnella sp. JGI-2019a]KAG9015834.1 hypothetical protein FRB93_012399 [Tulasnella sp. JGI-2019a]KAG9039533.1 hypothetical protein FRB95_009113 [Tulasnella sp. JGI-2019a]